MKKFLCILLACFMLASVPLHGYAVTVPTTFGIGVEVILPFLLSLLGVQSKNEITTYQDLESYHDEVYDELVDGLAGIAGANVIQNWLIRAASGIIDTDSVVWQKIKEIAVSNYSVQSSSGGITADYSGSLGNYDFTYYENSVLEYLYNNGTTSKRYPKYMTRISGLNYIFATDIPNSQYLWTQYRSDVGESSTYLNYTNSYTFDNKTVYFSVFREAGGTVITDYPSYDGTLVNADYKNLAWIMSYGGYVAPIDNVGAVSDAFSDVLTASDKDDIVDGTSVIQLYNPSALQNGLEIIPGGDPEEDPNLRKIPFAITADWWNLLEQFGDDAVNQSVAAYNALNNLDDGTSTGTISRAWESLGLGSVVGSAQNVEEGIIDLTEENLYPRSSTVQQTVTDNIPSSLIPEAPDSGIDNDSGQGLYKLPDLKELFPFCIPFDLIDLLSKFVAEPETPQFAIALSTGFSTSTEEVDLHVVDSVASIVRTFELIGFVLALILITRNLIRG